MRRTGKEGLYARVIGDKRGLIRLRFERAVIDETLRGANHHERAEQPDTCPYRHTFCTREHPCSTCTDS